LAEERLVSAYADISIKTKLSVDTKLAKVKASNKWQLAELWVIVAFSSQL